MTTQPTPYIFSDPEETPAQRIRRRLQQARCANCGTPNRRQGRPALCKACEALGLKYCPVCATILPMSFYSSRRDGSCAPCNLTRLGHNVGAMKGWQPGQVWQVRTKAIREAENWRIAKLLAAGATWQHVSEIVGLPVNTIRCRYYRWEREKANT